MIFSVSDITRAKVDCIINPANGLGVMHKGVSRALNREGGPEVLNSSKEVCFKHGLYQAGEAYISNSGFLEKRGIKNIVNAVTIYRHPAKTTLENIRKAIESSIVIIRDYGFTSFAIPSIGIEPRNINAKQSALTVMMALFNHDNEFEIHVVDVNKEFIEECRFLYGKPNRII
jgi:O-acetyl-ADP-ribose deacetylase (regulator of RNase III)